MNNDETLQLSDYDIFSEDEIKNGLKSKRQEKTH